MKGERKIAGYVKRYFKHDALASKYRDKINALQPLKRKVDAALTDLRLKGQTLTGGEQQKADKIIEQRQRESRQKDSAVAEVMQGFDNRHED